ncbi:hypothetical protein ACFLQI_00300 [Candidatus Undinarchaeota archaeon]
MMDHELFIVPPTDDPELYPDDNERRPSPPFTGTGDNSSNDERDYQYSWFFDDVMLPTASDTESALSSTVLPQFPQTFLPSLCTFELHDLHTSCPARNSALLVWLFATVLQLGQ